MRILLSTFGSYGDINPYLALGKELQSRRFDVVVATAPKYREVFLRHDLCFVPVRPDVGVDDHALMKLVMDPKKGSETVIKKVLMPALRETIKDLEDSVSGADLLVSHVRTHAVPILAEKYRKTWISTVLSPMLFASAYEPPVLAPMPWLARLRILGPTLNGWLFRQLKRISRSWSAPVAELRRELGLPPGQDPLWEGQHSPHLILAMFSRHFGSPQPDWPDNVKICGFPFLDRVDEPVDVRTDAFLSAGPSPIVFTLGSSAVMADGDFFRLAVQAAERVKHRTVLVAGPNAASLEPSLSSLAIALDWANFPALFARASVVVHSGGVGTTAQAVRSGVPQLVIPFAHDQCDNADRVRRMGCGHVLLRKSVTEKSLVRELELLMSDNTIRHTAKREGSLIRKENGVISAADAICSLAFQNQKDDA